LRIVAVGNTSYRWVEVAPGLKFEVRRLSLEEQSRIFGKGKSGLKDTKEYVDLALRSWAGVAQILGTAEDPPCNKDTKFAILEWFVVDDEDKKVSLWSLIQDELDKQDSIDLKN
jgi:hypothetical protein